MPHFYIKPDHVKGTTFTIPRDDAHHLVDVLRVAVGDTIDCFDGTGKVFKGKIGHISRDVVEGTVLDVRQVPQKKRKIILYSAVPKGDRFDWLTEKAAELGVTSLVPLITARSVMKNISGGKVDRWQRISLAASEQSNRADIMKVTFPMTLQEALDQETETGTLRIIPWESEASRAMQDVLSANRSASVIEIFIGPEGGFTEQEVKSASAKKIIPVTLGETIYRVETAGIVAAILAQYGG